MDNNDVREMIGSEQRLLNANSRWAIGIILAVFLQTAAGVWWAASVNSQVQQNRADIIALQSGAGTFLSRSQVEDLLGVRDQRLTNIENAVTRIETKLDRISQQQ